MDIITAYIQNIVCVAFSDCTSLKALSVPEGVLKIGEGAFDDCTSLKTLSLPDSLCYVGAFSNVPNLEYQIVENNISYIGNENNPYVMAIGYGAATEFELNENTKVIYPQAFDLPYVHDFEFVFVIHSGIKYIGDDAFGYVSEVVIKFDGTVEEWSEIYVDIELGTALNKVVCTDGEIDYTINYDE